MNRFPIRRAALRFLSTPSVSFTTRSSRTITSFTPSSLRIQSKTVSIALQKRWASDEAKASDLPISQLQPTPQEEVENAIHEDNAAQSVNESSTEPPANATQTQAHSAPDVSTLRSRAAQRFPTETAGSDGRMQPKPTVYIGNLFFDVTEDDLTKELARFGKIQKVKLIRDARGLSKGFGYVTFSSVEEASKAVESLHQQLFEGRRLNVAYASQDSPPAIRGARRNDKPINPPSKTLFIGNMSWDMNDRDLNNLFRGIKNVIDVRVAIDRRTGQPRGFAHADFTDVNSAMEAYKMLENKETNGRRLRLDYSFGSNAAPKNEAKDKGEL